MATPKVELPVAAPRSSPRRHDLLRAPVLGRFLRWVHARTLLQAIVVALAVVIILDGIFGPQLAPRNLAGVLPWVHWRGFIVLALLIAGNLFCMACPFMLPRRLAKRLLPGDRPWPRALRSKWLAVGLLLLFFWAYEAFALWQSPWLTAWIAVTYFVAAFLIDGFFRGAGFCKYVCPIGQFHFAHATLSPLEVAVRDPYVCRGCRTKDCIRGRFDEDDGRLVQNGCELWLFQERKVGNLDCTFCMECIHACPHDNVGILTRRPGRELIEDPWRSGVGRIGERRDLAALAGLLTFAAFVNAFGMTRPVQPVLEALGWALRVDNASVVLAVFFGGALVALPGAALAGAGAASRRLVQGRGTLPDHITPFTYGLLPLGLAMWTAHYLYHLLVGGLTLIPLLATYLEELGLPSFTPPHWAMGTLLPETWLLPLQVVLLQVGLAGTLWVSLGIARRLHGPTRHAKLALLPWGLLATLLFALGIWLLQQPMEMRGTFPI